MFSLKGSTPALRNIVLLAACVGALTSCERQGTSRLVKAEAPDPRILKKFGETGSRFCSFEMIYSESSDSESSQTKKIQVVATGKNSSTTATSLTELCAGLGITGKILCSGKLEDAASYPCVHESMFTPYGAGTGEWQCRMVYSLPTNGTEYILLVTGKPGETVQKAITEAFTQCAEIKGEQTEVMRNACATAMIERNMICTDLSAPPTAPPPAPRTIKLSR